MRRVFAAIGSAIFFVLAPGFVVGVVPWWISHWQFEGSDTWRRPPQVAGGTLVVCAMIVLLESFTRFVMKGLGTPAPVFPTRHLVVSGLYHYVRNPMYVAVVAGIMGQGLIFETLGVLEYGALVWLAAHLFVIGYEEPTLRATFGPEYQSFCTNVPRWIPRIKPWAS